MARQCTPTAVVNTRPCNPFVSLCFWPHQRIRNRLPQHELGRIACMWTGDMKRYEAQEHGAARGCCCCGAGLPCTVRRRLLRSQRPSPTIHTFLIIVQDAFANKCIAPPCSIPLSTMARPHMGSGGRIYSKYQVAIQVEYMVWWGFALHASANACRHVSGASARMRLQARTGRLGLSGQKKEI